MLVDTGATYPLIAPRLAEELGLEIVARRSVMLADGREIMADVSFVYLEVNGRGDIVQIRVFETAEPVLGVFALEAVSLAVDPVSGELRPTRGFLARA